MLRHAVKDIVAFADIHDFIIQQDRIHASAFKLKTGFFILHDACIMQYKAFIMKCIMQRILKYTVCSPRLLLLRIRRDGMKKALRNAPQGFCLYSSGAGQLRLRG